MGVLIKFIDAVLFFFFLVIALGAPLIDSQTFLPLDIYPTFLIDLKTWYVRQYDDYLLVEKPHFFIGALLVQLLLQWPLAVASLYAIIAGKSWLPTTCLIYGASAFTSVVTILSDMIGSGKASEKHLSMYAPFLGFAVIAFFRGLLPNSGKANQTGLNKKKRA